jgi:GWxTD domain-containing protein
VTLPAVAQRSLPSSLDEFYSYGDNYFFEIATLPGTTPPKGRALISFRLTYDLLNFRKAVEAYQKGGIYFAPATLYIEAIGSDGVIADRAIWRDTARVQDYALTNSKHIFLPGSVELSLRPGLYTIKYTFESGIPESNFTESAGPIKMDDFNSPSPAIGMPIFLRHIEADTAIAAAIDGNALFGEPIVLYLPLASAEPPKSVRYELLSAPKKGSESRVLRSGGGTMLGPATLGPAIPVGNDLRFRIYRGSDPQVPARSYAAVVTIATDDLPIDDYILAVTYEGGNNSVTDSVRFRLQWEDMPLSLTKADYAIRALYPIATDDTIDLLIGSKDRQDALQKFWEKRDPTPKTKFNEAMAEYYRRVDYAFFNFKSLEQKDGLYTDRGKIYILFGPPTDVVRELQPDASPREIWTYGNAVAKKFIFVDDAKTGEYKLMEYYDL